MAAHDETPEDLEPDTEEVPEDTRTEAELLEEGLPEGVLLENYLKAVDLVEAGYRAILGVFNAAKERGLIPKGRVLAEAITSGEWTVPPLLDAEKFVEFQQLTCQYYPDGILSTVWYILVHFCDGPRFVPAITIDRATGHFVVMLAL